jgi:glycosyltransferase involved in cell wall biosynthesis
MRITIIADSFPPLKNSAAVLVFSLAEALAALGHQILVITPSQDIDTPSILDDFGVFKVLRLRCGRIKSYNKLMRGIQELSLFFTLPRAFQNSGYQHFNADLIIWYSPSIFFGGLVKSLKKVGSKSYLILRDIVPQWLLDVGLMKKGLSYHILKWFELYQYRQADFIGVQSPGNRGYIETLDLPDLKKLEVLPNWMPSVSTQFSATSLEGSHTNLEKTILAGKKVLIYAGNVGEAQGIENFSQLLHHLKSSSQIGFLIIGRGSKKAWLQDFVDTNNISNVLILDEVDLVTLSMYYRQSAAGLVFLDLGHQSHNIPGKFISYLEAGLPVIACINSNNDLVNIVKGANLGLVGDNPIELADRLVSFLEEVPKNTSIAARSYYEKNYQPKSIAQQILNTAIILNKSAR